MQRVHMQDKAPTITEVMDMMWEQEAVECLIKCISANGVITVRLEIVECEMVEKEC